jgi:hypothetical protein
MCARRFLQVCVGFLLLAVSFEFGAVIARGQSSTFRVIGLGIVVVGDEVYEISTLSSPYGWRQLPHGTFTLPPVPPSTLVNYVSGQKAITDNGDGWGNVGGVWTNFGPVPGIVSTQRSTWGQLKAKYRDPVTQTEKVEEK